MFVLVGAYMKEGGDLLGFVCLFAFHEMGGMMDFFRFLLLSSVSVVLDFFLSSWTGDGESILRSCGGDTKFVFVRGVWLWIGDAAVRYSYTYIRT